MNRQLMALVFALILLTGIVSAENADPGSSAFKLTTGVLPNGLRYVIDPMDTGDVVAVVAYVRAGSIYEKGHIGKGLSHLCEHIIHEGTTTKHGGDEYTRFVEQIGNNSNAFTSKDQTRYFIVTTSEHWGKALGYIGDWMFDCQFAEDEFTREKGVVTREIEKAESEPNRILSQAHYENMFQTHAVRYPVLGYKEVFQTVTREDLYGYYKRMYIPQNIILGISGAVNASKAEALIREQLAGIPRGQGIDFGEAPEPRQLGRRETTLHQRMRGGYLRMGFRSVTLDHPDLFALDVLSNVLSQGATGRAVYRVKEQKALAFSVGTYSYTPMYKAGIFGMWAVSAPDKLREVEAELWKVVNEIKSEGVRDDELVKVKKNIEIDNLRSLRKPENRAQSLVSNLALTGNPLFDMYYVENIKNVTAVEVQDVCRRYLNPETLSVTYMVPPEAAAAEGGETAVADKDLTAKTVLPNGIVLLTRRCGNLPLVNLYIAGVAGTRVEADGKEGLNRLFARMLLKGSAKYSRDDIINYFDRVGGNIGSSGGRNTFSLSAEVLTTDLPETLDIINDVLTAPGFPEAELAKEKKLTLQRIKSQNDSWQSELSNLFREEFYRVHPYRHNPLGTDTSLPGLKAADLESFHRSFVFGSNLVVGLFGDVDDEAVALTARILAGVKPGEWPGLALPKEPALEESRTRTVVSDNKGVAGIFVGFPGVSTTDIEDNAVLEVIDAMTSGLGYPGGWLHESLRGQQLVYMVHAFNSTGMDPGYFGVYAGCDPTKVDQARETILKLMARLAAGEFTDEELTEARELCVLTRKIRMQTPADFVTEAVLNALYGLGHDFQDGHAARIQAVDRKAVQAIGKRLFGKYVMVITRPEGTE